MQLKYTYPNIVERDISGRVVHPNWMCAVTLVGGWPNCQMQWGVKGASGGLKIQTSVGGK